MVFIYAEQAHVPSLVAVPDGSGGFVHHRVVTDQVGSVRLLVNTDDSSPSFAAIYHPFGGLADTEQGTLAERFPFRFAGGLWDADTGLIRFGARDYDPSTGRWLAKDPVLFAGGTSGLYEYAFSAPNRFVDPDGENPLIWFLFVLGWAPVLRLTKVTMGRAAL